MTEPITIRAGDLTAKHIGWRYRGSLIKDISVCLSTDTGQRWIHPGIEVTLSPPTPIRRRITWADLQDVPPRDWEGATVVGCGDTRYLNIEHAYEWPRTIAQEGVWLTNRDTTYCVIEVPAGHPLATCGEAA